MTLCFEVFLVWLLLSRVRRFIGILCGKSYLYFCLLSIHLNWIVLFSQ